MTTPPFETTPAPEPYPYAQYPPPGLFPAPEPSKGTNKMAIAAFVLAFVFPPAGIYCGHVARRQIRPSGEDGDGLALAGLIVSYLLTGILAFLCCGGLLLALTTRPNM